MMTNNEFQLNIIEVQRMIRKITEQNLANFSLLKKERITELLSALSHLMDQLITLSSDQPNESNYHLMSQTIITNPNQTISEKINLKEILNNIEIAYIHEALIKEKGIVSHAAKRLGIRRTTLVEKMKKFEITKYLLKEKLS